MKLRRSCGVHAIKMSQTALGSSALGLRGPDIINLKSLEFYNISSLISLVYSKLNTTIFSVGSSA